MLEPLSPSTAISAEAERRPSPSPVPEREEAAPVQRLRRVPRRKKPAKIQRDEETELSDDVIRQSLRDTSDIVTVRPNVAWPVVATAPLRDATVLPQSLPWSIAERVEQIVQLFQSQCELPTAPTEEAKAKAGQSPRHKHCRRNRLVVAAHNSIAAAVSLMRASSTCAFVRVGS